MRRRNSVIHLHRVCRYAAEVVKTASLTAVAGVLLRHIYCVNSGWLEYPRLVGILKGEVQHLIKHTAYLRRFDRKQQLDTAVEVPAHPIGTAEEILRLAAIVEEEYPAVFKIAVDDAYDVDIFFAPQRTVTADAPYDKPDLDSGFCRLVEQSYHIFI